MKKYPVFKYAEWIKENNKYYLAHENLLDGIWYIELMPKNLQEIIIKVNEQDWSYGLEYDINLQILKNELETYLDEYYLEYLEKEYLKEFLNFCYVQGIEKIEGQKILC